MTKNTGYQVIDLGDLDLSNIAEGTKINGIYEKLVKSNRKAIYLTGLKYNGTLLNDAFAIAYPYSTNYILEYAGITTQLALVITNEDVITVQAD